jgi:eukaryotic-like serine/threonine-protein kinase
VSPPIVFGASVSSAKPGNISRLEHPNVCPLYDVGEHEGHLYLVMQFLDGETLAERLQAGPLPIKQTLDYAIQIAEALAAAHRADIVHRDLKPGNVIRPVRRAS